MTRSGRQDAFMRSIGRAAALSALAAALWCAGCSLAPSHNVRTHRMGDEVQLGDLAYTVYESGWHTHLGEGAEARVPQNRFFLVRVRVANKGNEEVVIPEMTLADEGGQTYRELSAGDRVPQWMGLVRALEPGQVLQGNIAFDCAPRNYKLRITDEAEKRAALIDIPLAFGSETPETPAPELPKTQ